MVGQELVLEVITSSGSRDRPVLRAKISNDEGLAADDGSRARSLSGCSTRSNRSQRMNLRRRLKTPKTQMLYPDEQSACSSKRSGFSRRSTKWHFAPNKRRKKNKEKKNTHADESSRVSSLRTLCSIRKPLSNRGGRIKKDWALEQIITATIVKQEENSITGLYLRSYENKIIVARISGDGLFSSTPLIAGDEVLAVNNVVGSGSTAPEVAEIIGSTSGPVTLLVRRSKKGYDANEIMDTSGENEIVCVDGEENLYGGFDPRRRKSMPTDVITSIELDNDLMFSVSSVTEAILAPHDQSPLSTVIRRHPFYCCDCNNFEVEEEYSVSYP